MSNTRRTFLKSGSLAALLAMVPTRLIAQAQRALIDPADPSTDPLQLYTQSAFSAYVGSIFSLHAGKAAVEVKLMAVTDLLATSLQGRNGAECFSLTFRGESQTLTQDTYLMEHPALGSFNLFLVPGGKDNGEPTMVAIVNRLPNSPDLFTASPRRAGKLNK